MLIRLPRRPTGPFGTSPQVDPSEHPSRPVPGSTVVHRTRMWARVEVLLLSVAALLAFLIGVDLDIFEVLIDFTRKHEDYEIDEFITAAIVLGFFLSIVFVTRSIQLSRLLRTLQRAQGDLADALALSDSLRAEAEMANQAKTNFLAATSHELRTPLTAILGFSDMMRERQVPGGRVDGYVEYAGYIHRSGADLLAILEDLLDIAKIEAGRTELHPARVDVAEVVAHCLRNVSSGAARKGLRTAVQIARTDALVTADTAALQRMITNLVTNAIKYNRPGGDLTIRGGTQGNGDYAIQVADTGVGMPDKDIPRALLPYERLDAARTSAEPGVGLGLAIVHTLMLAHGGSVEVDSTVGEGTTVTLRFPAAS
ncbi:sensor histidine kinase [Roseospira navarrensis]|nr:HAMP domain-containing sensor histidine kinase [Roseospira navarrensis]